MPIYEIEIGKDYLSPSGIPFRVLDIVSHGQDCSIAMVVYKNLIPTKDYPKNHKWVIEESIFYKTFSEGDPVRIRKMRIKSERQSQSIEELERKMNKARGKCSKHYYLCEELDVSTVKAKKLCKFFNGQKRVLDEINWMV